MRTIIISISMILSVFLHQLNAGIKTESIDKTVEFKAETLFVYSFERIGDYVYIIGTLRNGAKLAYQVGGNTVKSDFSAQFRGRDYILINNIKCVSITDIEKNSRATWYKLYVGEWRNIVKGGNNKLITKLSDMGVQYIIINDVNKDKNKFQEIPPVLKEKLKIISE